MVNATLAEPASISGAEGVNPANAGQATNTTPRATKNSRSIISLLLEENVYYLRYRSRNNAKPPARRVNATPAAPMSISGAEMPPMPPMPPMPQVGHGIVVELPANAEFVSTKTARVVTNTRESIQFLPVVRRQ